MDKKKRGFLTMRLKNMNDYLERVEKIQAELNQTNYRPGTADHVEVNQLVEEINQRIKNIKQIGFVKVGDEDEASL